jgi:hypothetical protein
MTQQVALGRPLIKCESDCRGMFRGNYNKTPFLLEHELHRHPLFEMPRLAVLAQKIAKIPGRMAYSVGQLSVNRGWEMSRDRPLGAQEVLDRLESADAWVILKSAQVDPEYAEVLSRVLQEIHEASGRQIDQKITAQNMSVILTSPGRITPYHMDADCNYLLQIKGRKCIYVFDGSDREVVSCKELEHFYAGNVNAATYKESAQEKARAFSLEPGNGVHVPVGFPHWVQNEANISISVSINFCFVDRTTPDIYRVNHYLRKGGLHPAPPGESTLSDKTKKLAAAVARMAIRRPKADVS